jgi:hypothetical protein
MNTFKDFQPADLDFSFATDKQMSGKIKYCTLCSKTELFTGTMADNISYVIQENLVSQEN